MSQKNFSFVHTLEVELSGGVTQEFSYTVYATYVPYERGHRDSLGAPEEPDYPSYIEIQEIYNENGQLMPEGSFTEEELEEIIEAGTLSYEAGETEPADYDVFFDDYWP